MNFPIVFNIFGMFGSGIFFLAIIRIRFLDHKSVSLLQKTWDSIAGTCGIWFDILTFLAGAGAFAGLWLFLLAALLLRNRRPTLPCAVVHVTGVFAPAALLGVPGILTLLAGPRVLGLSCVVAAILVLWILGRTILYGGDIQPCSVEPKGSIGNRFLRCIVACLLIMVPIGLMLVSIRYLVHRGAIDNGVLPHTAYIVSFDTEIDWCPQEDAARNKGFHPRSFGLDSYKYITCGLLEKLASGLSYRGIPATFYCTPDVAKDHPEVLRQLEKLGHEIGVHLHMDSYPSLCVNGDDELSSYTASIQASAIQQAKNDIEKAVEHAVHSFRSGQWSCDPGVEEACVRAGFQSISNHESTYLLPSGMWQIATAKDFDILMSPRMFWRSLKWDNGQKLIPLFSHPMVLFDHATNQPREEVLGRFFQELDEFRLKYPDIQFVTTTAVATLLKYSPPSIWIRVAAGTASSLLILGCIIVFMQGQGSQSGLDEKIGANMTVAFLSHI